MMHYKVINGEKYGFPTYRIQRKCLSLTTTYKGQLEFKSNLTEYVWREFKVKEAE